MQMANRETKNKRKLRTRLTHLIIQLTLSDIMPPTRTRAEKMKIKKYDLTTDTDVTFDTESVSVFSLSLSVAFCFSRLNSPKCN